MSGFLGPVVLKVFNLLGMTSLGQKTKATALGVTLASDEDALGVTDNGGSLTVDGTVAATVASGADVTEGAVLDAAVTTDTTGTLSGKLRGLVKWAFERMPASLGQKAMAASLPVVVASDQSAVPGSIAAGSDVTEGNTTDAAVITDTTGTLSGKLRGLVKWAFERMPASLGQKTKAASLPVTLASDEDPLEVTASISQRFDWVAFSQYEIDGRRDALNVIDTDITVGASRTAGDEAYGTTLTEGPPSNLAEYFSSDHASFDATQMWFGIPVGALGYKNFWLDIRNELGVNISVAVYGLMTASAANGYILQSMSLLLQVVEPFGSTEILASTVVGDNANLKVGNGGTSMSAVCNWPFNYIALRVTPASDPPAGGEWFLTVCLGN